MKNDEHVSLDGNLTLTNGLLNIGYDGTNSHSITGNLNIAGNLTVEGLAATGDQLNLTSSKWIDLTADQNVKNLSMLLFI